MNKVFGCGKYLGGDYYCGNTMVNGKVVFCDDCDDKEVGIKHDQEKLDWSLIPIKELEEVVRVLQFGRDKYSKDNWKKIDDFRDRYFSAAMRHIVKWKTGHVEDKESGFHHLAHAICCLLFLIWKDFDFEQKILTVAKDMIKDLKGDK